MAKKYDEMDLEELKKRAAESEQRYAALKEISKSDPAALRSMSTDERIRLMRENEQERVDKWHQQLDDARARHMKGVASATPGRYAPGVQEAAVKWLNEQGYGQEGERRRQFDVTNETERVKARGKAAAEIEVSRNRDGWWDDKGNFHPGASVRAAEAGGTWRLEQQRLKNEGAATVQDKRNEGAATVQDKRNEGAATVEDKKNQRSTARNQTLENIATTQANANVEAARERQRKIDERRAQQDALAEQRDFEKFKKDINNVMNTQFSSEERMKFNAMKPEEQKAFWKEYQGRQQRQTAGKIEKGTEKKFPNGDVGVWDGTKWVKKN